MPSFELYKKMSKGNTCGESIKIEADQIVNDTWNDDLASRVVYLYDWYHDKYKNQLDNFNSPDDNDKIPIDAKYIVSSSQTFAKDTITYHLQFRPGQQCNVPYYEEFFHRRYDAKFPSGLYVDVPDSEGKYNRWLVVGLANYNDPQFPTYEILRCDYVVQYIHEGIKYNVPVVLRSQNS